MTKPWGDDVKRARRAPLVALLTLALLVPASIASAPAAAHSGHGSSNQSRWTDLQRKIKQTRTRIRDAKARERGIIAQINQSDIRRRRLEEALAALGSQLALASAHLGDLEAALGRTEIELDRRTQELERTMALLDGQMRQMSTRAAEKYMSGPLSFAPVLLNTDDFSDFASADQYVDSVIAADLDAIEQVRATRDEIQAERSVLGVRKQEIGAQVSAVQAERDRIAGLRAKEARARRAVVGELNYRKSLLERVRDEREAYEEALQSYLRESDSIAGILRNAQKGQKVVQGAGKGYLVWPVSGRISSGYGWRTHPVHKKRAFHTGIDIAAPSGSKIVAARAGKVVYTGYKGAFGLVVLVDHGDSVATMYSHLSRASVGAGQKVKRGAVVGSVGCTGWCTGPHLHFEVRVGGEPTNPLRWL